MHTQCLKKVVYNKVYIQNQAWGIVTVATKLKLYLFSSLNICISLLCNPVIQMSSSCLEFRVLACRFTFWVSSQEHTSSENRCRDNASVDNPKNQSCPQSVCHCECGYCFPLPVWPPLCRLWRSTKCLFGSSCNNSHFPLSWVTFKE